MRDTVRNYSIGTFSWGSPIVFFVWGLSYSSNRHVTPVSVRGRKGLTCSIRAAPCPRFDTLRQSVSNRAQLFLAVYTGMDLRRVCRKYNIRTVFTTVSTLWKQLTRVKDIDPDLRRVGVVYV